MTKKRVPAKLRRLVRQRALGYCEYCICPEFCATQLHSNEHIIPESRGGKTAEENLALACQGCNGAKANKTQARDPATGQVVPLFHPRRDIWHEHFTWSSDHLYLIGLTSKGRATVHALDLNRAGVVHLRRLLILNNEHPPIHRSSEE
jgi:hypothetical protein